MTVRIRVCEVLDVPPRVVWAAIEDLSTHTQWMADAARITFRSSRRSGVGTEAECLTRIGPFSTLDLITVTEWVPGRVMGVEHHGAVTGHGRFTLRRQRRGRTRFCWEERLSFPWRLGGPIGERLSRPLLRRVWRANLARLKARVEPR